MISIYSLPVLTRVIRPGVLLILGLFSSFPELIAQTITTVAGNGTWAFSGDGGPATQAALAFPYRIALDVQGNLFIADRSNQRIRKVAPNGIITTVAGNGLEGYEGDGGPATNARLNHPSGVAVDAQGNLYIADYFNKRVRKVGLDGIITTVAGNGTWWDYNEDGGDGGPATQASLGTPNGIAVDRLGNLFIATDVRVRKVAPNGIITTLAGNGLPGYSGDGGPAINASFFHITDVAVDTPGNLYLADEENNRVRKVDTNGIITTVAGNGDTYSYGGDGGAATLASLHLPHAVAVDPQGNLLIADQVNQRIRRVTPDGRISTVAGNGRAGYSGDNGAAILAHLNSPAGLACDAQGTFYFTDQENHRIRRVKKETNIAVASFSLINTDNQQEIKPLNAGEVVNLSLLPTRNLAIRANTEPATVGSVVLQLSGRQNYNRTENQAPYALFGDAAGRYTSWTPMTGSYSLIAIPFTGPNVTGSPGTPLTLSFQVADGLTVVSFSLIDADTDRELKQLAATAYPYVNFYTLPTRNLAIRANTSPATVGSVKMVLSGQQSRTQLENAAPYALFGDDQGDFRGWTPKLGGYTLTGTVYSEPNGNGKASTPLSILFRVVDLEPGSRLAAETGTQAEGLQIQCYPNPFNEFFQLKVSGPRPDQLPMVIYDGLGRVVLKQETISADQQVYLGPKYAPGVYLLQVGQGRLARRFKLLKVR